MKEGAGVSCFRYSEQKTVSTVEMPSKRYCSQERPTEGGLDGRSDDACSDGGSGPAWPTAARLLFWKQRGPALCTTARSGRLATLNARHLRHHSTLLLSHTSAGLVLSARVQSAGCRSHRIARDHAERHTTRQQDKNIILSGTEDCRSNRVLFSGILSACFQIRTRVLHCQTTEGSI